MGAPSSLGRFVFSVSVRDASGGTASGLFSLNVTDPPPPTPPGCQTGGILHEGLKGQAIGGQTPTGTATSDERQFSGCGGFSVLADAVQHVALADGTGLWVTLDFKQVGTIRLTGGQGTMHPYNMGDFAVSFDQVRVFSSLPDMEPFALVLIGHSFG